MGQNLRFFLFLAAARSSVVSGDFESAEKDLMKLCKKKDLEKARPATEIPTRQLEEAMDNGKGKRSKSTDSESLPQVRFEATKGNFFWSSCSPNRSLSGGFTTF